MSDLVSKVAQAQMGRVPALLKKCFPGSCLVIELYMDRNCILEKCYASCIFL
jgi:hypothetical protein